MTPAKSSERLARLSPGLATPERFEDAERHRRRVKRLKIALPLLAAVAVSAIFVSLIVNRKPDTHLTDGGVPAIEMSAPVLRGIGDNGKPFEVRAAQAAQTREGLIELTDIEGRMELEDGVVTIVAARGHVSPETNHAVVEGGVKILLDDKYTFETERAEADMKAGIITGDSKVRATGPMGVIDAAGFRVERSVKQITFLGGVTSVLDPAKAADMPKVTP